MSSSVSVMRHSSRACPLCGSRRVRDSYRRGIIDTVLKALKVRPYRCGDCYERFYRHA